MKNQSISIKKPLTINNRNKDFWVRFFELDFDFEKSQYLNDLNFRNLLNSLSQITLPNYNEYELEQYSLDRIIKEVKSLSEEILKGVNMKVPFFIYEYDENENRDLLRMYNKLNTLANIGILTEEQYIMNVTNYFIQNTTKRSVFGIPIEQVEFSTSSGLLEGKILEGPCMISYETLDGLIKFVKKVGPLNERVYLGKKTNSLTVGSYIHEIVHCLLDRNKGIVENYFYDEFLSIFIEKVAIDLNNKSDNKTDLKIAEMIRLKDMQELLKDFLSNKSSVEEKYDIIKYIQSGILAGLLFDKYEKTSKEGKEKILIKVRDVLNGKAKIQSIIDDEKLSIDDAKIYFNKIKGYIQEFNKRKDESDVH